MAKIVIISFRANKTTHCADMIAQYYNRYAEHKGTQFVFSDLGTYKPDYMEHAAERKPPVLHAMPKTISIKEVMSAGKDKGMTGGISQPEDGTEKPQDKPKWRMKL